MRLIQARKILKRWCSLREEWSIGRVRIRLTGRDPYPRFDRRLEIYLSLQPEEVDPARIKALLRRLDRAIGSMAAFRA